MKQTKEELEEWYQTSDPWSYEITPDDKVRKEIILSLLDNYETALDIGCGEGFITKDIPSKNIYGLDISDNAALRFPNNVKRILLPENKYDLVMSTGTLYQQYDYELITNWIKNHSSRHILVGGIKDWIIWDDFGKIINEVEFKYRQYTQILRLYEVTT
jgi:SAM-dependent methyltransferase